MSTLPKEPARIRHEKQTVTQMIAMYCRAHHPGSGICAECAELLDYALTRLTYCRYKAYKPTCSKCPVHCYKPDLRVRIQEVMRYAGPRMMFAHPVNAIRHLIYSWLSRECTHARISREGTK